MTDVRTRIAAGDLGFLEAEALSDFVLGRRWFGAKAGEVVHTGVLSAVPLRETPPLLAVAFVEVRFQPGTHDVYQVPLGFRPSGDGWGGEVIGDQEGWTAYDALADPVLSRELVHRVRRGETVPREEGALGFHRLEAVADGAELLAVRPMGAEQSNTSVVFDDALVLKAYRRLEAGANPELELLAFLTERGFRNIPALTGWYEYVGRLMDATLGIVQEYVPSESDGWTAALASLADDSEQFLRRVRRLGEVTGEMHVVLGSDPTNADFAPEETSTEALGILAATVDEEIEELFLRLPDWDVLEPIAGRGEEVREQLRLLSQVQAPGRVIRHHGDYHLGQVLWTGDDWVVIDFEGEPARTLPERRRKRSPLRDVAGMLRSFGYAASAFELKHGVVAAPGWEQRAREEFLAGYVPAAEAAGLLPPGQDAVERLLAVFELQKAVYELRYELDNRPDWVHIPIAGLLRLLARAAAGP
jgi:maltokinase